MMKLILLCTLATNILVSATDKRGVVPLSEKSTKIEKGHAEVEEKKEPVSINEEQITGEGEETDMESRASNEGETDDPDNLTMCQRFLKCLNAENENIYCCVDKEQCDLIKKLEKCIACNHFKAPRKNCLVKCFSISTTYVMVTSVIVYCFSDAIQSYFDARMQRLIVEQTEEINTLDTQNEVLEADKSTLEEEVSSLEDLIMDRIREVEVLKHNVWFWHNNTVNIRHKIIRPFCYKIEQEPLLWQQLYNITETYEDDMDRECLAATPAPTPRPTNAPTSGPGPWDVFNAIIKNAFKNSSDADQNMNATNKTLPGYNNTDLYKNATAAININTEGATAEVARNYLMSRLDQHNGTIADDD